MFVPLFFSVNARVATDETTVAWEKSVYINDPLAFENFWCISADIEGNLWVLTHTPDGQIFLSVNGHKIWWNKNADPEIKEPTALITFSAGGVKNMAIAYEANSILPNVMIEGTVWGILTPDPTKKQPEKYLYKLIKSDVGYSWQKEESLAQKAEMVSACNDGSVVVMTSDGPYQNIGDGAWNKLGTIKGLKQIAAGNKNAIFALSEKNAALTWKDGAWELLESGKQKDNIRHIVANDKGVLYCTDKHGKAFYFSDKQTWVLLPNIFNAQQIAVSPKKHFCWTSEPYGNALLKNHVSFLGKAGVFAAGGGVAILGTGALGGIGAGILGAGAVATAATIAGSLEGVKVMGKKLGKATQKITRQANRLEDMADDAVFANFDDVHALNKLYKKESLSQKFTKKLSTIGAVTSPELDLALALSAAAIGVITIQAIPVIVIDATIAAVLFGAGAAIVLMILSRPHNNEIYECENISKTIEETLYDIKKNI